MQKKIHVILPRIESSKKAKHKILKVAVYCRVSKNTPVQLQSLEMQELYFEKLVNEKSDWELYKIYNNYITDEEKSLLCEYLHNRIQNIDVFCEYIEQGRR